MLKKLFFKISLINQRIGKLISYLSLALVFLVVYDVSQRYFFSKGSAALQELEWHLFAAIFLIGVSYTQSIDKHVRVDIFYSSLSEKAKSIINIFGAIVFLLPFASLVIYTSYPFIESSFLQAETSPDAGGLPYRFLVKSLILIGFSLLFIEGVIGLIKDILSLVSKKGDRND